MPLSTVHCVGLLLQDGDGDLVTSDALQAACEDAKPDVAIQPRVIQMIRVTNLYPRHWLCPDRVETMDDENSFRHLRSFLPRNR
jgi:hypothetical protein